MISMLIIFIFKIIRFNNEIIYFMYCLDFYIESFYVNNDQGYIDIIINF